MDSPNNTPVTPMPSPASDPVNADGDTTIRQGDDLVVVPAKK